MSMDAKIATSEDEPTEGNEGVMTRQTLGAPSRPSGSLSKLRCFARASGVAVAMLLLAPVLFAADRLSDDDVKAVLERIDWERDRFEDQLDGRLKRSILRGPGMEVNVERFLDDLQENLDTLKERFTAEYAASAEVTGLLNQASAIQQFMSAQPPDLDGASEWNRLAESLAVLAAVYGTVMPIPVGQQARRMNDREVEQVADNLAKSADRFKKDLDSSLKTLATIDKSNREAAIMDADGLKKDAERLASVVGDRKPASGEAKALLDRAARLRAAASAYALSASAQSSWRAVESGLGQISQAFGLPAAR
jgi:uncharacterized membrane-anchored protein YhcB (DUF1043 family)